MKTSKEAITIDDIALCEMERLVKNNDGSKGRKIMRKYLVKYIIDPDDYRDDPLLTVLLDDFAKKKRSILFQETNDNRNHWILRENTVMISIECFRSHFLPNLSGLFPSLEIIDSSSWRELYGFTAGDNADADDQALYCTVDKEEWSTFVQAMKAKKVIKFN